MDVGVECSRIKNIKLNYGKVIDMRLLLGVLELNLIGKRSCWVTP